MPPRNGATTTAELPDGTSYVVRPFESGDETEIRQLYGKIRKETPPPGWLRWKFRANPQSGDVGMFVADGQDEILGIRPFIPVRMRSGKGEIDAVCFVNALIRPEFRGKGVFSTLSDRAIAYHTPRSDLLFCFANENSAPIYEHWGWNAVRREVTHFRFNNPGAIAGEMHSWLALLSRPLATTRILFSLLDSHVPSHDDIEVRHFTDVPVARFARLYQRTIPEKIHVVRDESYCRWRLNDPCQEWSMYVAVRDGEDIGALVTRSWAPSSEYTRVDIEDAIFLSDSQSRDEAVSALLSQVMSDTIDHAVIAVPDMLLPRKSLRKRGFVATDWPLLSELYDRNFTSLTLFVKPVSDLQFDVTDPNNWLVSFLLRTTN